MDEKKKLFSIEFFTENGEHDGYFSSLTESQAAEAKRRLEKAAEQYGLGKPKIFQADLAETPDFKSLMEAIEERYPT